MSSSKHLWNAFRPPCKTEIKKEIKHKSSIYILMEVREEKYVFLSTHHIRDKNEDNNKPFYIFIPTKS